MKKTVKLFSLIFTVIILLFTLSGCTTTNPPSEDSFSLQNDFSQRTVKVGSNVTYKVNFKNLTGESYTLEYVEPIIFLEIISVEENENRQEISEESIEYHFVENDIAPHGQIEEFIDFKPTEPGDYLLKASCKFKIHGKDYDQDYEYHCEDLTITVIE